MIIKCLANKGLDLPKEYLVPASNYNEKHIFPVNINQLYVVYGMTIFSGYVWYFLMDNIHDYPFWHPSPLFSVSDGQLSRYWVYSVSHQESKSQTRYLWTFPEWANFPGFYDDLVDGKKAACDIFFAYKLKIDLEFPNPSITLQAEILDGSWLMCPSCIDAWETDSKDGMVFCPKCLQIMHNPFFKRGPGL